MKTEASFWDTSAIIPLYCNQIMSPESRRLRRRFNIPVVWWGTHVEVNSGMNRLLRAGLLTDFQFLKALEKWEKLRSLARIIKPEDQILVLAAEQASEFNIRSLDAFQLAAALVWCSEKPRKRPFICADTRLSDAAENVGFDAITLL